MEYSPLEKTGTKIKTFAYQSIKSFHKSYKGRLTTYRNKQDLRDFIKVGTLGLIALFFGGLFMYYINLASTRGYFMKLALRNLNATKEKSDIVKLEIIRKKRENRDNLLIPKNTNLQKNLIILQIPELQKPETQEQKNRKN